MAESATKGESGVNLLGYSDYRGVNVIGAWKWNSEYNFGLATEIEFEEAYSTLLSLRYAMILAALIGFVSIVVAYFYIRYSKNNERLSLEDGLTGIANRRMLDLTLKNEFNHSMRYKKPLSILMIDVDFFKSYNDVFGHLVGDDALRKIAGLIKDCVHRKSDLVARYGGEEFCVVLPDTPSENAHQIAEKIREKVFAEKIDRNPIQGLKWITVSIGIKTLIVDEGIDIPIVISQADAALYQAKNAGRNRTQIFEN